MPQWPSLHEISSSNKVKLKKSAIGRGTTWYSSYHINTAGFIFCSKIQFTVPKKCFNKTKKRNNTKPRNETREHISPPLELRKSYETSMTETFFIILFIFVTHTCIVDKICMTNQVAIIQWIQYLPTDNTDQVHAIRCLCIGDDELLHSKDGAKHSSTMSSRFGFSSAAATLSLSFNCLLTALNKNKGPVI